MLDKLKELDTTLFLFLNSLHNDFFDFVFFWISDKLVWLPLYIYLAIVLFKSEKKHFFYLLFFLAIVITLSDQISSGLIKESVMRLRPSHDPLISMNVHIVNDYKGGAFGFVSSHASNSFALAFFIIGLFRNNKSTLKVSILIWAIVVSYSRIYLGVHYPGDILGGAIIGAFLGFSLAALYRYCQSKYWLSNKI